MPSHHAPTLPDPHPTAHARRASAAGLLTRARRIPTVGLLTRAL
ncbi:hypothetical protein [Streptomyces aquilus]